MEFEPLEKLVLADRSQWKDILAKISINSPDLYKFLHLLHTNQNGSNDAEIKKILDRRDEPESGLRRRYYMSAFDKMDASKKSEILNELTSQMSLSLYDTKTDTSSSYATTDFVPRTFDPKPYTFDELFKSNASSTFSSSSILQNPFVCHLAFEWAAANPGKMDRYALDRFLDNVKVADSPHLVGMLAKQMTRPSSEYPRSFGDSSWHRSLLTLTQLEELRKLVPNVIDNSEYVRAVLDRLVSPTADILKDAAGFEKALQPVQEFVSKLSHVFNGMKALVMFNILDAQVRQGKYDESLLNKYLAIPKYASYENSEFISAQSKRGQSIPSAGSFDHISSITAPSYDTESKLVAHFITQLFIKRPTWEKSFETMVNVTWLKDLFARTKLLYGPVADAEKHKNLFEYSSTFDNLKKEIRLQISPYCSTYWSSASKVALDVEVKNVQKLIVKLFEINTLRYYRDNLSEIPSDISLEGLVPSEEKQYEYDDADHVSVMRQFTFPALDGRSGVFVIEFVGAGRSQRAVIYKGRLNVVQRSTIAGHVFTIMNEKYEKVIPAHLWMSGHLYHTDEEGEITIPFASSNQSRTVVVYGGDGLESAPFAELYNFTHQSENYSFDAQFHVDRESLVPFNKTAVLVKPKLLMNNSILTPVSLLTDVFLTISTVDIDGVSSSKDVSMKFADDADYTFDFQVPDRLTNLSFSLRAVIKKMCDHSKVNFSASKSFSLNGIDRTDTIEQFFLRRTPDQGYTLHMLGKTGDAVPRREVSITGYNYFFTSDYISQTLTTDDKGVIALGKLNDFTKLNVNGIEFPLEAAYTQNLLSSPTLHLKSGQALQVALNEFELAADAQLKPEHVSLVSVCVENNNVVLSDFFHLLKFEKGMLNIPRGLMAGTYRLTVKRTNRVVTVFVQQALQSHSNFLFGSEHILEKSPFSMPLQISSVVDSAESVKIALANTTPTTRVHVFVSEYLPEYDVRDLLRACPQPSIERFGLSPAKEAQYVSRELSEEQRYILDRKYAPARQGNTLTPPSLLLNPWAVDTTKTTRKDAGGGDSYGSGMPEGAYARSSTRGADFAGSSVYTNNDRNFDFKFHPCKTQYNVKPDAEGTITIKRSALGGTPTAPLLLRIVAVDASEMVFKEHTAKATTVPEPSIAVKDLRLKASRALNPADHFAEQKGITLLQANEKFTVEDLSTSKIEVLDSLGKVYSFFTTISNNQSLKDWNWLLKWDAFTPEEKEEKYHEFASHELHLFIYFKDRTFFDARIAPYLKNKMQKTFIDEWLLISDPAHFAKYAAPGTFNTLNAAEKALLVHRLAPKDGGDALAKSLSDLSTAIAFSKSDRNKFNHLFKTVLGSSSLNTESDGYVPEETEEAEAFEEESLRSYESAMPSMTSFGFAAGPPPPAMAPAPMMMLSAAPPPMASRRSEMKEKSVMLDAAEEEAPMERSRSAKKKSAAPSAKIMQRRAVAPPQLFQAPEKTKKYAESQYFQQPDPKQSGSLISMNAFWSDYAIHRSSGKKAFVSKNFIYATGSFAEMVFAIAVLDLPLSKPAQNHPTEFSESGMTLTALAPVIVFHKDIKTCEVERRQVLVAQNFFDPNDMHTTVNGERVEKYIEEEFLNRKVYGCNYIVTNISSSPQRVEVLLQLPVGAVPVLSGSLTKSVFLDVSSYTTQSGQFYFYFPRTGDYQTFPVHVSRDEKTIAWATMQLPGGKPALHVVDQLSKHDLKSWTSYISQLAPNDQVYAYLQDEDIFTIDLSKIAWRMRDAAFFKKATQILRGRSTFNRRLWAYAISHQDKQAITELMNSDRDATKSFVSINADLAPSFPGVTTNAWAIRSTQHYEFWPLINARAHQLGSKRVILNDGFKAAYQVFLRDLAYRSVLSKTDLLVACYYMLLQDRVEEGMQLFERAKKAPLEADACPETVGLQVDYLAAYLDFYNEKPTVARDICAKHIAHPVLRWRRMFQEMKKQLDEFDTGVRPGDIIDPDDRNARMGKAAHSEPTLDVETVPGKILLNHHSLTTATLSFYKMDIELLFSAADYKPNDLGKFAYVKPNFSLTVKLAEEGNETVVVVPKELDNCNVMIEVVAGPHAKVVSYFSHSLLCKVSQSYGQIQVHDRNTGRAISRVYVKVFSLNKDGSNRFYKDGYTDLRGGFDYASLSTDELGNVSKFYILVMSPHNGTRILEAAPPAQ